MILKYADENDQIFEGALLMFDTQEEILRWSGGKLWSMPPMRAVTGISILNSRGVMEVSYGNYILKDQEGNYFQLSPENFIQNYRVID